VKIDGNACNVISAALTEIKCLTPPHAAGSTNVVVSVGSTNSTNTKTFEYDAALTPTVTSISPLTGKVTGNEVMTIAGSGFGTSTDAVIKLGDGICTIVTITDTEIKCKTPSQKAGSVPIKVTIPGKGATSVPSSYTTFEYILKVTSISPLIGSLAGGTEVTITGEGFSETLSDNSVKIGSVDCVIKSSTSTTIKCIAGGSFKTKKINNFGTHPGRTLLFSFALGYFVLACLYIINNFSQQYPISFQIQMSVYRVFMVNLVTP